MDAPPEPPPSVQSVPNLSLERSMLAAAADTSSSELLSEDVLINLLVAPPRPDNDMAYRSTTLADEHVIITAIIRSWDAVADVVKFDAGWQTYKDYDERIMRTKNHATRMAAAWYVRRMRQYRNSSNLKSKEAKFLPPTSWAEPRPGMREQMCWQPSTFLSNRCLQSIVKHHQMLWPHSSEDCYRISPVTKRHQFTPAFRLCMTDLRCWTLESRFFEDFPDLRSDAAAFEMIALRGISDPQTRTMERLVKERDKALGLLKIRKLSKLNNSEHRNKPARLGQDDQ